MVGEISDPVLIKLIVLGNNNKIYFRVRQTNRMGNLMRSYFFNCMNVKFDKSTFLQSNVT